MVQIPLISVITPMYNESLLIENNLHKLIPALEELGCPWELIVVNDGSTDNCCEIARRASQDDERVQIISYQVNRGRGYALRQGFKAARGKYIITTESDLSWGPNIIGQMLGELKKENYDMVIASPYLKGGKLENVPLKRAFLSRYGNKILTLAAPGNLSMISGMTRGYKKEVIDSLDLYSDRKEIHLEIVSKVSALGYRIGEIPATLRWEKPQTTGEKRKSSFKARQLILSHLMFSFNEYPLLLFGVLGALLLLLGSILGFYALYLSLSGIPVQNRPLVISSVLLILFGIQLIVFSFLSFQIRNLQRDMVRLTTRLNPYYGPQNNEGG